MCSKSESGIVTIFVKICSSWTNDRYLILCVFVLLNVLQVRIDSSDEYSESNSILVTRIQFLCIEIARNREGHNDNIRNNFKPKPRTKKSLS